MKVECYKWSYLPKYIANFLFVFGVHVCVFMMCDVCVLLWKYNFKYVAIYL